MDFFIALLILAGVATLLFNYVLPWYSRCQIRRETLTVDAEDSRCFSFYSLDKRVLSIKFNVLEGAPVDLLLATAASIESGGPIIQHFADFSTMASLGGYRQVVLPEGAYTLVLAPHSTHDNAPSVVDVELELAKARPFQRVATCNEFAAPY